jgi:hypothetical protein
VVAAFSSLKENLFMVDQQKGFALAAATKLLVHEHGDCCHPQECMSYNLCLLRPQLISFEDNPVVHPPGHMDASKP